MSKNLVQRNPGHITLKNLSALVEAGIVYRRSGFVGVAIERAPAGASVAFALEGIWGLTYPHYAGHPAGALLPKAGSILYWDTSASTLSIGRAVDDYAVIKCTTDVSSTDGSYQGLLLPQGGPKTDDQS